MDTSKPQAPGTRVTLNRIFTKMGLASRSQGRDWILAGRVKVNGRVEKFLYAWVDLDLDEITLDDQALQKIREHIYILFNKPCGLLTSRIDQEQRPTIYDVLPPFAEWIFPVGRLDRDTEGLLLLTNDGPMGDWIINPESGIIKTYAVQLDRAISGRDRKQLESGIELAGYRTRPARITPRQENWLQIEISEGKNRQIRKMMEAFQYRVLRLIRTHIGPLLLGDLPSGQWRYVDEAELHKLQELKARQGQGS
jgi:23S rRNA pseudouridine2605 synthase